MTGKSNSDHRLGLPAKNRRRSTSRRAQLVALLISTTAFSMSTSALAGHSASIDRIGRWLGVGWGDGYHACRDGGIRPGADLPPQSFHDQFGPSKSHRDCGEIYPPGAGMAANRSATPSRDETTCDHGACDAASIVGNPIVSRPILVDSSQIDSSPMETSKESGARSPAVAAPATPLNDDSDAPLPSWVDRADSQNRSISKPTDRLDSPRRTQSAGTPMPESAVLNLPGRNQELTQTDPREVALASDFVDPTGPEPPPDVETKLDAPIQPALKPNRLPPVPKRNDVKSDERIDDSHEFLPPPAERQLDQSTSTIVVDPSSRQPANLHDNLLDGSLLDDRSLIEEPRTREFGVPAVKDNPFFETKSRVPSPSTGRVISRVAKRPGGSRIVQPARERHFIRQPD